MNKFRSTSPTYFFTCSQPLSSRPSSYTVQQFETVLFGTFRIPGRKEQKLARLGKRAEERSGEETGRTLNPRRGVKLNGGQTLASLMRAGHIRRMRATRQRRARSCMPPLKREETFLSDSIRGLERACASLLLSETAGITYGNFLIASFQSVPPLSRSAGPRKRETTQKINERRLPFSRSPFNGTFFSAHPGN